MSRVEKRRQTLLDVMRHPHRSRWYVYDLMRETRMSSGLVYACLIDLTSDGLIVRKFEESSGRFNYALASRITQPTDHSLRSADSLPG